MPAERFGMNRRKVYRGRGNSVPDTLQTSRRLTGGAQGPILSREKSRTFRPDKGLTLEMSALKPWPIYVINLVDKTKLPCYTLSRT